MRTLLYLLTIHKSGGDYYLGENRLSKQGYRDLMEDCPEAWDIYKNRTICNAVGWVCAGGGLACLTFGLMDIEDYGGIGVGIGIGLGLGATTAFILSKNYKTKAYKEYNKHCARPATLSMGVTGNGLGIVLNF